MKKRRNTAPEFKALDPNILLGHVEIKIRDLPASGSNTWWSLYKIDGKVQKKGRGEVHLIQHLYIRAGKLMQHTR